MQTLPSKNGKSHPMEYFFRIGIMAGLVWGGIKLFNWIAPTLIETFQNIWLLAAWGIPTIAIAMYIISNPMVIWMGYKTLCKKITSWFIRLDPLSFMQRYIDLLMQKLKGLQRSKLELSGKETQLEREIQELENSFKSKMKLARAAEVSGDMDEAKHQASMANQEKESIKLFIPILQRMKSNIEFLDKLESNWKRSIEKLQFTVNRKKKEWEMLKTMAKALGAAEEFASGDTEANRIYNESVLALEEKVTSKLAYIEEFEKSSKGIMKSMNLEKAVNDQEGLELLEQYKQKGDLLLSEDFSDVELNIEGFNKKDLFAKRANNNSAFKSNFSKTSSESNEFNEFLK